MRTTLDIEDDLLQAARELAARRRTTIGKVVSDLLRRGFEAPPAAKVGNGVPLLPRPRRGSHRLTMETVNSLRDQE